MLQQNGKSALYVASRGSFPTIVDMLIKAERDRTNKSCNRNSVISNYTASEDSYDSACNSNLYREHEDWNMEQVENLLGSLARNHLEESDWKKLAKYWQFSDDQIKGQISVWEYQLSDISCLMILFVCLTTF